MTDGGFDAKHGGSTGVPDSVAPLAGASVTTSDTGAPAAAGATTDHALSAPSLLMVAALSTALLAQGGYHQSQRILVSVAAMAAAALALWRPGPLPRPVLRLLIATGALAAWAVARAVPTGPTRTT